MWVLGGEGCSVVVPVIGGAHDFTVCFTVPLKGLRTLNLPDTWVVGPLYSEASCLYAYYDNRYTYSAAIQGSDFE